MNGFIRKKVKSMTLGEKMQRMRKERRISLREISRDTRVQVRHLEALEKGDYSKLPPSVYVKGFLRSYADFFGIKHNYLIKSYEREMGIQDNINGKKANKKKKTVKISGLTITPKIITIVSVIVMIIFGLTYLYLELDRFISVPRLIIINPSDGAVIERSHIYVQGITDPDGEVFINEQPIVVDDEGKFKENIGLQKGVNVIKVKSVNRFNKEAVKVLNINANFEIENAKEEDRREDLSEGSEDLKIEISAKDDPVWVSIEADKNLVYSGTLLPHASQKFEAENEIKITSGNGNNTLVKINGKDLGTLSDKSGIIKDVTFTSNGNY